MFHDPRLFDAVEATRPAVRAGSRIGPGRPAIAPLALLSLGVVSLGLWGAIAYVAQLI